MIDLILYDGSEINRPGYRYSFDKDPIILGFRESLRLLSPSIPFLVRGNFGDGGYEKGNINIKNTFSNESLSTLVSRVLSNGHEKDNPKGKGLKHPYEESLVSEKGLKYSDLLWAEEYKKLEDAMPYRFYDDTGCHPQGNINDFSMIIDSSFYIASNSKRIHFYQSDVELRKKALVGIIVSDTNPNREKLKLLQFSLTTKNLEEVMKQVQDSGYFYAS